MKCEVVQPLLMDYHDGDLEEETRNEISSHLQTCPSCSKELSEIRILSKTISENREEKPDEILRINFNSMLQSEIENIHRTNHIRETPLHKIISIKWSSPLIRIAAGVAILIAGIWIGHFITREKKIDTTGQLAELKDEMRDVKEMLMFSMLNGESASQRIKAVNYSSEIQYPNQKVIDAYLGKAYVK